MRFSSFVFHAKQRLKPRVINAYRSIISDMKLSSDELSTLNWDRRQKLLHHAYFNVPYYREAMTTAGMRPVDVINECTWSEIPVLTKTIVRNRFNDLISSRTPKRRMTPLATGGSTGEPLRILQDRSYPIGILGWRMLRWWNVEPFDNVAFCWRQPRKPLLRQALGYIRWWPTKRILIDATHLSESSIRSFIVLFNRIRPVYFHGYTGAIYHISKYILDNNLLVHSPKVIWGTSSPISEVQREVIETAFSAPLCDQYGCAEVYWLAAQCKERQGLHVFSDVRHIEILNEENRPVSAGESGAITITDLVNYGFPLIRYQNGDRGRLLDKSCPCGLCLPLLAPVQGRVTDLIQLPSGSVISGDYATTLFDAYPTAVNAFQVYQASDYSITIRIVPGNDTAETNRAIGAIVGALEERTHGDVPIRIEHVSRIDADRGKYRYIISDVQSS